MHFTQYDEKKFYVDNKKREEIRKSIHKQVFNEDVDLDKMVRGDETFVYMPVIMLDNFFYKDNKYYILYSPNTDGIWTVSKTVEQDDIDEKVYDLSEEIAAKKMPVLLEEVAEFNKMNNPGEDDDSQGAQ